MTKRDYIGEFEQLGLHAILQPTVEANGPNSGRLSEQRAGRRISRGALYATLDRLEGKKFLEWRIEAASSNRGGNRRRLFKVTRKGVQALASSRELLLDLWSGLDRLLARSSKPA